MRRAGPRDDAEHVVTIARSASKIRSRRPLPDTRKASGSGTPPPSSFRQSQSQPLQSNDGRLQPPSQPLAVAEDPQTRPYELPPLSFQGERRQSSGSGSGSSDSLAPLPAPEPRQVRERKRYSLVDPGAQRTSSPSPLRPEAAGPASPQTFSGTPRGHGRPSPSRNASPSASASSQSSPDMSGMGMPADLSGKARTSQPKTRYTTFEEMGIKAKKQTDEKECVIM